MEISSSSIYIYIYIYINICVWVCMYVWIIKICKSVVKIIFKTSSLKLVLALLTVLQNTVCVCVCVCAYNHFQKQFYCVIYNLMRLASIKIVFYIIPNIFFWVWNSLKLFCVIQEGVKSFILISVMIVCCMYITWLMQFKLCKLPTIGVSIMVVGALTFCALLYFM